MKWKKNSLRISLLTYSVMAACLFVSPGVAVSSVQLEAKKLARIESVVPLGDGFATEVAIKLSSSATYTSYKTTSPLRLVIDLSQVTQGNISAPLIINKGNFKSITASRFDTDAGVLTRLEIELVRDSEPVITVVSPSSSELRISFPSLVDTTPSPLVSEAKTVVEPLPVTVNPVAESEKEIQPTTLSAISVNKNVITLALDGPISAFNTFRLNKPERYVVDLMNVKSGLSSRLLPLNASGVASARIGLYPDKVRVVLDSVNGTFPEAASTKTVSGIEITLDSHPVDENTNTKLTLTKSDTPVAKPMPVIEPNTDAKLEPVKTIVADNQPTKDLNKAAILSGIASVEMIDFQQVNGISRVSVKVAGTISVDQPVKTPGYVTLTIKNSTLPKNLQRSLETSSFVSPILRITPFSVKNKKSTDTKIRIVTRMPVPFEFRQEADMLYIDFKHPEGLAADKLVIEAAGQKNKTFNPKPADASVEDISSDISAAEITSTQQGGSHVYKGRKVTLEFADADVRKIFQLLAEVSGKNFVLGDDVTGNISLKLVNVPWDQALDIILDTKELDSRETGNVLTIKKKGKLKSIEEEQNEYRKAQLKNEPTFTEYFPVNYNKVDTIKSQLEALLTQGIGKISSDVRTNTIIITSVRSDLDKIKSYLVIMDVPERQVMIEARIVEASSTFTRDLGVSWGVHYRDGSASFLGINSLDNSFGGLTTPAVTSGQSGVSGTNMGISFGRIASNIQLDMRLNAAATAGLVKIVSTPKIATLNNKTAKITQGQSIPYVNNTATTGNTTEFVQAVLSLEVKPHINSNGTIGMEIKATNNSAGTGNPPSINTKEATTEMLLKDGETTVIGGIYKEDETQSEEGVPYLMDIPFLGNLFKSTSTRKIKSELLIFITPRILN
ncbi:MAG: type IV pilus secretin PilQ [Desulfuromonadaceae bacterium]|nr:type IV pilus secretin PilQ [Desulfuromonadaceae bacterium]MDD2847863.1 type IV pilus secretin PilQ [Desulfuromonadaceae bacterium]MDD4129592.1 type IV pilus secretin PilQ [Desulfuromonadaceae bacterium]